MKCKAKTQNGQPCQAQAIKDSKYCFIHDPAQGAARAKARKRGGERHRTPHGGDASTILSDVKTLEDAKKILIYTLAEIMPMENSLQRARVLIALFDSFVRALEIGELEERITALEDLLR
jgi:hypothetical protein